MLKLNDIVVPFVGLAWILLNKTMLDNFSDHGNFSPWRIFVLVCSFPSLISVIMLYFLPETPKFLISKGQYEKAKIVFQKVFTFNTGHPYYVYPVRIQLKPNNFSLTLSNSRL
jgi:VNT family MFS transporter (synaptic vesicle glycoprotein 2)